MSVENQEKIETIAIADLKAEHFEPLLNQSFSATLGDRQVEFRLSGCKSKPRLQVANLRVPFNLSFETDTETNLPQGTYSICFPTLGTQALFLVPASNKSFQASFN